MMRSASAYRSRRGSDASSDNSFSSSSSRYSLPGAISVGSSNSNPPPLTEGVVSVQAVGAKDLRKVVIDGADVGPYLSISLGKTRVKTGVDTQGGKNPIWNHAFAFQIAAADLDGHSMTFEVKNKKLTRTRSLIGSVRVKLRSLSQTNGALTVPLSCPGRRNESAGSLELLVHFQPGRAAATPSGLSWEEIGRADSEGNAEYRDDVGVARNAVETVARNGPMTQPSSDRLLFRERERGRRGGGAALRTTMNDAPSPRLPPRGPTGLPPRIPGRETVGSRIAGPIVPLSRGGRRHASRPRAPRSTTAARSKYEKNVSHLRGMGFSAQAAQRALQRTNNDFAEASKLLLYGERTDDGGRGPPMDIRVRHGGGDEVTVGFGDGGCDESTVALNAYPGHRWRDPYSVGY